MVLLAEQPARVAILEADVPMPELEAQFGRYGDMFDRLLLAGAKTAGLPTPLFSHWDVVEHPDKYPDPIDFDAILITGSRHSAYDDVEWINNLCAYVKKIYEDYPSKKIIGVCFGHQIVARALGGKVEPNEKGWEMAVRQVNLVDSAKKVFDLKKPVMRLQQMHRDIVTVAPPGAAVIGSNEICACQAMVISGRMLSVQGHPEFNQTIVEFLLQNRHFRGLFNDEVFEEAFPKAAMEHDGVKVGEGIMNFIMGIDYT